MVDGMKDLNISIKRTSELTDKEMHSIIFLKQQYWGYSDIEQQKWMRENIRPDDYHLQIYGGGYYLPT